MFHLGQASPAAAQSDSNPLPDLSPPIFRMNAGMRVAVDADVSEVEVIRNPRIVLDVQAARLGEVDVYLDDTLANDLVSMQNGLLILEYPFTESEDPFVVEVRQAGTAEVLESSYFRFETNPVFDEMEIGASFQNDTIFQAYGQENPGFEGFDATNINTDFRFEGDISGKRGWWGFEARNETVGSTIASDSLNPDGPQVDVSHWSVENSVEPPDGAWRLAAGLGDVNIAGANELVNAGMRSRGTYIETRFLGDQVRLAGGNVLGNDVVGLRDGLGFRAGNRRTSFNLTAKVIEREDFDVEVVGSFLDAIRPAESNFGIAQITNGETNRVYGGGLNLSIWGDRIRTRSRFGYTEYANPIDLDPQVADFDGQIEEVGTSYDTAQVHRVDLQLWNEPIAGDIPLQATFYGGYAHTGALYRSVQAFVASDRVTWNFGLAATLGLASLTLDRNVFDNNVDDTPGILKSRQANLSGVLSFDTERYRGSAEDAWSSRQLVPTSVRFSGSWFRTSPLNADDLIGNIEVGSFDPGEIPIQSTMPLGMDLDWQWQSSTTRLSLFYSTLDNQQEGREEDDTVDKGFEISQDFQQDVWDVGGRFRLSHFDDENPLFGAIQKTYSFGVNLGVRVEELPDFVVLYDFDVNKVTPDSVEDNRTQTFNHRASGTFSFAKYLPEVVLEHAAYLNLTAQWNLTEARQTLFEDDRLDSVIVNVTAGFRFSL